MIWCVDCDGHSNRFDFTTRWYEFVCTQHLAAQSWFGHHLQRVLAVCGHANYHTGHFAFLPGTQLVSALADVFLDPLLNSISRKSAPC